MLRTLNRVVSGTTPRANPAAELALGEQLEPPTVATVDAGDPLGLVGLVGCIVEFEAKHRGILTARGTVRACEWGSTSPVERTAHSLGERNARLELERRHRERITLDRVAIGEAVDEGLASPKKDARDKCFEAIRRLIGEAEPAAGSDPAEPFTRIPVGETTADQAAL